MKQFLIAVLVVGLAGGAAAYLHFSETEIAEQKRQTRPKNVNVYTPQTKTVSETVVAVGDLRSREAVTITGEVSGRVVAVNFSSGQIVQPGKLLVQLDDRQAQADLQAAQAELRDSQRQLKRASQLQSSNSISQSQVDELRTAVDVAKAALTSAQVRLENHSIRAPFAGKLGLKEISTGAYLESADPITTLDAINPMELAFSVPERFLGQVSKGQKVVASAAAYPSMEFSGELVELGTRVDNLSRTLAVRALVPNEDGRLLPGMFMSVELSLAQREALVIPEQAILMQGVGQYVFVMEDGKAMRQEVTLGVRDSGYVEVIAGVAPDAQVVITGQDRLSSGDLLQLAEEGDPIPVSSLAGQR